MYDEAIISRDVLVPERINAMHEKKNPNKPLIVYYIIALVVVMLLNALLFPQIERYSVKQVDYSEFLSMLEDGKVKSVEIDDT